MTKGEQHIKRTVQERIEKFKPWFHNIHLPNGMQTAPDHFLGDFPKTMWSRLESIIPEDLTEKTVLDIGCNAGFYSLILARRGAQVIGIDSNDHYLEQARWVAGLFDMSDRILYRKMQVYDLRNLNVQFDIVLFMGVLYHLRYPLLGLDIVSRIVKSLMIFQSLSMPGNSKDVIITDADITHRDHMLEASWPKMAFIEHRFAGDPTNWWAPNASCMEAMLRSSGMRITGNPSPEIYVCEPDTEHPSCITTWDKEEFEAATAHTIDR
ncbi:MAG: TIGR04290 family methyltransferase [Chitinivibrionales bacterium]|nr:TIGR04290 family methyltransferase [Chitinivibrionales bacterium]